jgi:hypothetical protein
MKLNHLNLTVTDVSETRRFFETVRRGYSHGIPN